MIVPRLRHLSLALVPALAATAAGCGGGEEAGALLSQTRANTLLELLDAAEQQFEDGECDALEDETLPALEEEVVGVSNDVDESFRAALDEETQALQDLASDCQPQEEETTTAPTTVPPPTTETAPPTVTEMAPPTTTEEETTTEEAPPPEEESDEGEDSGSGSDSGGVVPPSGESGGTPPSAGSGSDVADSGEESGS